MKAWWSTSDKDGRCMECGAPPAPFPKDIPVYILSVSGQHIRVCGPCRIRLRELVVKRAPKEPTP